MSLFPPVTRPNGKVYYPRKYRFAHGEDAGINSGGFWCLVLGTHDFEVAREIAERESKYIDPEIKLACAFTGWWRESIRDHEPYWGWDEIRGAAGVMFTEDC